MRDGAILAFLAVCILAVMLFATAITRPPTINATHTTTNVCISLVGCDGATR